MSVNIKAEINNENTPPKKEKEKQKGVNTFVLLFVIVVISAILTYLIPAGTFERVEINGRTVVQEGTFQYKDSTPVGLFELVTSIPNGMVEAGGVIFFVLLMGGYFGILRATGAIDALITLLSKKLGNHEKLTIPVLMLFFAIIAALTGAAESNLVYIPILVPLVIALGFDTMTGLAIILVGSSVGFTAAVMNPFTVGVAQEIAELPIFSGLGLRLILLLVLYTLAVIFVYRYAIKVKKNPELGDYGKYAPQNERAKVNNDFKLDNRHKFVLFFFVLNFIVLIFGVLKYNWFIQDLAGLFFLFCILVGFAGKLAPSSIAENFVVGAKELLEAALIIGVARAILVVLSEGQIMDTILFHAGNIVSQIPTMFTPLGMFIIQMVLDFFVPSGSGKAALTMPIMVPLSDLVGVTRQTTILAYQFGDGITNLIFPTSSYLMAALSITGIAYGKWLKWLFPFLVIQLICAIVTLLIAQFIQYGPF
ncbi:AbgT family transporter [Psychrobacillus sp. NEAU-3TGS]|uniref:YfcC family protein n=1 Tax=Psychrobacillus sp. NEAU-3TGS TaxID=2995412 RepID=UPI0024978FD1|nr:AbgT family transporter [Psychrobacillus sp. NEAU-3TGS]MDI2586233.1 AbgT family transporter [Psychrobacillus sp. NEAU-3TGS]